VLSYTPITRRIEFNMLSLNLKNQISLLFSEPNPVLHGPSYSQFAIKKTLKESEEKVRGKCSNFSTFLD